MISSVVNSAETDASNQFYEELLERHKSSGHLSSDEIKKQKFYHSNQKSWQNEFENQVRGVASTLKSQREILKFQNPAIEIPVK